MGTRSDFYVGPADALEWIGTVGYDGYPDGLPKALMGARTKKGFRSAVEKEIASRDDGVFPDAGWPWPWNDSTTSDYGYWHNGEEVLFEVDGHWIRVADHEIFREGQYPYSEEHLKKFSQGAASFPDMSARKNVNWNLGPMVLRAI